MLSSGVDIIQIERIKKIINKNESLFLNKIFTENEIAYLRKKNLKAETIAGYFAAKEAASKALGTGFRGISFKEIEIIKDEFDRPVLNLKEKAKELFVKNGFNATSVSISHEKDYSIAFVIFI